MIIALVVILIVSVLGIAIAMGVFLVTNQSKAKKQAVMIISSGKISDTKKAQNTLKILNTIKNDMEAADLWQKLNKMLNH